MLRPSYFSEDDARALYLERTDEVAAAARARRATCPPAADDRRRRALLVIDPQLCFCHPRGSLYVPGAADDVARVAGLLYDAAEGITTVALTADRHGAWHVFSPDFWVDAAGAPPAPFTVITDLQRYRPVRDEAAVERYLEALAAAGKVLTIWPYHATIGGPSGAIAPAIAEAALFHALARGGETLFLGKGEDRLTEHYSALGPEVPALASAPDADRAAFTEALLAHDEILIAGQAKSHCVRATVEDLLALLTARGEAWSKLVLLDDGMSPVPAIVGGGPALDFPARSEELFARFAEQGVRRSTVAAEAERLRGASTPFSATAK